MFRQKCQRVAPRVVLLRILAGSYYCQIHACLVFRNSVGLISARSGEPGSFGNSPGCGASGRRSGRLLAESRYRAASLHHLDPKPADEM